jgi:protein phosphatase
MTANVLVSVFGKSDLGRTRDHNEDTFLVADLARREADISVGAVGHVVGPRGSLFMVADGMGGAAAGELASSMAAQHIYEHLETQWMADPDTSGDRFAFYLREAVEYANQLIHAYALQHPEVRGMGTTVTAAGVHDGKLYLAQIGDSRAYLVRGGRAFQLTKDQSLTQRLVDAGELTEEEAEASARRNIILQALGPDPRVKVVLTTEPLRRGDTLLLCSDGLSNLVRRDELAEFVAGHVDLAALCSALIDTANERGGPDNITVVAAHFHGEGLPLPAPDEEPNPTLLRSGNAATMSDDLIPGLAPPPPPRTARAPRPPRVPRPGQMPATVATAEAAPPAPVDAPAVAAVPAASPARPIGGYLFAAVLAAVLLTWLLTR